MDWYAIDTWIVIVGMLAAASCALLGNFLVLRKMSMMGDAISHAVLPGLAIAFLLTGGRASYHVHRCGNRRCIDRNIYSMDQSLW